MNQLDKIQNTEFPPKARILDLKIQKQISPSTIAGNIYTSAASQRTRRKLHKKVFERIKESKWGTSCKSM